MKATSKHFHTARPGESVCFVCKVDMETAIRDDGGLSPVSNRREHVAVVHTYGDQEVEECRACGTEWPCPAIKAITRNAARARRNRADR